MVLKLQDLIYKDFPELINQLSIFPMQWRERKINEVSSDSRHIQAGWIFVAIVGNKEDGHLFIPQAIAQGAEAIVVSSAYSLQDFSATIRSNTPILVVDNTRKFLSLFASRLYGKHPENILAVTGTSGKSSVASFVQQICQRSGLSSFQIGPTSTISSFAQDNRLTTPSPIYLAKALSYLSSQGVTHVSVEASSHGLDQHRLDGIKLIAGSFTNLGRDHIDYHQTQQAYFNAKMRLFEELLPKESPAIIYADDAYSKEVMKRAHNAGCRVLSVGYQGKFIHLKKVCAIHNKQQVTISVEGKDFDFLFPLPGEFQVYNALVAAGLCIAIGIDSALVLEHLEKLHVVPGRFEFVGTNSRGGRIYVDYAHTSNSLEMILKNIRTITSGRIIVVFGCGGDRDQGKRPIMGKIALDLADIAIVTDDNPRSEDPEKIRAEIIHGIPGFIEKGNRIEAIRTAIEMLNKQDVLVVAGKGHETVHIVTNGEKKMSVDCDIIREILGLIL
ncbi:UDP-N-acetylmuramoyl-L-alanyl-D-glutamate--2,6-diaminopimelate ligase [Candidatus Liberibacter asiaticus]|uniref:UDP-N-acetylmuramoyl-L-alanyl-D-glutamate--2, 6-diaminopimelate ligase n=1 Tax=Liberibacter asiaticus TaxID=34021 RepID=UPI001FCEAF91|nr:UDP-N-acetylmuramoyl-L-alanyl-D-glutamate--2,6-diaminopimelate ligase [Candidatus Liberibacter asiaticus]MCU7488433.1 UDP-N-acetylmuramoyl-L-alanyl-D-glutamate--2,6-diaminopimelate ligase [Candidatus Liberibacter asiaticus]MCU7489465.1 UDP-N-acetylmuramoyl-L-alanyl-D-glutamate--2,6-diaminopimelate ligase [Candidatus Liberibacter asiaticus]